MQKQKKKQKAAAWRLKLQDLDLVFLENSSISVY